MILVEGAAFRGHRFIAFPRLGHEHHHRVRERASSLNEELEHIVEAGRIALSFRYNREQLGDIGAEQIRRDARFAHAHPCQVATQRVDLAVVAHVAVRMRERPRWKGVRGEARVDQRERGREVGLDEVRVEVTQLRRPEHAFVDERAR